MNGDIPEHIELAGTHFDLTVSDDDFTCWVAILPEDPARTITLLMEPAGPASTVALESAASIVEQFDELASVGADFLCSELEDTRWALSPKERELLSSDALPFAGPEAVVWSDGSWMMRYAETPLEMGRDFGIGVLFVGSTPISVEDLADASDAYDDND